MIPTAPLVSDFQLISSFSRAVIVILIAVGLSIFLMFQFLKKNNYLTKLETEKLIKELATRVAEVEVKKNYESITITIKHQDEMTRLQIKGIKDDIDKLSLKIEKLIQGTINALSKK